jgi:cell division protein FtsW
MPGEIAKITAIWFVAWFYSRSKANVRSFVKGYLPVLAVMAVYFVLIYKQPSLSTALIVCGIIISMMFFAGVNLVHIGGTLILGVTGLYFMINSGVNGEHLRRITNYQDPFSDAQGEFYQTVQALLALGSGGVFGVGPGRSIQKALYLPEAQNDYIFAIIGEELGFIGCIALLLVYLVLIWRCTLVALRAPDKFGMLTAAGITVMLAIQVIFNIAVVTNIAPPTGVMLPFISYGGNAMLLFMGSMGIMMNIAKAGAVESKPPKKKRRHRKARLEVVS